MEKFDRVVGDLHDPVIGQRLHELEHAGKVVHLRVSAAEMGRRRLKVRDLDGTEYGIVLSRSDQLRDGAVLLLTDDRAVVVDGDDGAVLELRARSASAALLLGWHAGHLHWRVRFTGDDRLVVLLDDHRDQYLDRIRRWIEDGSMEVVDDP